jgi:uncharacterized SAM-binding protein YcdF (DUF218 family)
MFFALSKILWAVANPGNLFLLSLIGGGLGLLAPWRRVRLVAGWVLGLAIGAATVIAIAPVGTWLLAPLENRFPSLAEPPANIDGVILLGGALNLRRAVDRGGTPLGSYAERVTVFVELANQYPDAKLVFSGGSGLLLDQVHSEADYTAVLLENLGVPPDRVIYERDSRNTYENARYAKVLAQPQPGEVWLLVTSAFHMPRAVGVFRQAGWPVTAYPVNYVTGPNDSWRLSFNFTGGLGLATKAAGEWIGLLAYRWTNRTDTLFPGPSS